ncbi:protein PRRC1-like [Penaeus chinensis]|uniref:protein PRRC1-like n=1 Tax=Penaeus chinensis TaxID=139456 RepID=UPI001FB7E7DF|nr:protein PRRC1-like [Penaeus chinensis]XP_047498699.1 protein PRRC1-like [Penaeus chinensis]XP_047498700.1 protein PRRC1-like [Penaeus chinensis]XP_047498701.1 protein PRRC1-like [Penaeus chinensis]
MMQEDSNGDFEIVDKKMATLLTSEASMGSSSVLANVPPPSALPSFIASPRPPAPTSLSSSAMPNPLPANPPSGPPPGPTPHQASMSVQPPSTVPYSLSNTTVVGSSMGAPIPSPGNVLPSNAGPMPQYPGAPGSGPTPPPAAVRGPSPPISVSGGSMPPGGHQLAPPVASAAPPVSFTSSSSNPPITSQPVAPAVQGSVDASAAVDLGSPGVGGPAGNKGSWLGWIRGTVSNVGHRVAEKAKNSMDTMITTLDPQMKEFIHSGGDMDIIVASDKEVKVGAVREAFQQTFGKATVSGMPASVEGIANQPVGFEAALQSAEERINSLRSSGRVHPQQPIVAVENFIAEFTPDCWYDLGVLLLDDPGEDIILQTYTQVTPIPPGFVEQARATTANDYPYKNTGFSTTIGQIASQNLQVHHTHWQESLIGVPRRDMIIMAARALASLYKARLPPNH